jgi:hypothetical protein
MRDLTPSDRAQEGTLNAEERVLAALEDGPAYTDELVETTGLARGTVKNKITALKKAGRVEPTGEIRSQMEQVRLVSLAALPIRGSAASDTSEEEPKNTQAKGWIAEKEQQPATVAEFFANPPGWLPTQLKVYREDPDRHLNPLCATVAAVVLGDGALGDDVREEVKKELARQRASRKER